LNILGKECRVDITTSSQTFLIPCKAKFFLGIFKFFTADSLALVVAFIPRTNETLFLPFNLHFSHFYFSFWFV